MQDVVRFAKEITLKRIKELWRTYIGDPTKRITPNQIKGQIASAIKNEILENEDIIKMRSEIEIDIEKHKLYPLGPLSQEEKLSRHQEVIRNLVEELNSF